MTAGSWVGNGWEEEEKEKMKMCEEKKANTKAEDEQVTKSMHAAAAAGAPPLPSTLRVYRVVENIVKKNSS